MLVFKRKQIVILALVLLIVVAGYLQYTYKQGSTSTDLAGGKLGEAVYVDNEIDNLELVENSDDEGIALESGADIVDSTDISASKEANDFFAQAKMDRDQSRSKSTETLKSITEDKSVTKETVSKAYEDMITLTDNADREMRIETLVSKMGFSDCVALFADDGSVDVVVKTPTLTNAQVAQIADIVSRQADLAIEDIHIKKLY